MSSRTAKPQPISSVFLFLHGAKAIFRRQAFLYHPAHRGAAVGLVAGIALAAATSRYMASQLFGVSAYDPFIFIAAAALLLAIALAARFFPARRATRVDPMTALRHE